jgi:hypothetical protein
VSAFSSAHCGIFKSIESHFFGLGVFKWPTMFSMQVGVIKNPATPGTPKVFADADGHDLATG